MTTTTAWPLIPSMRYTPVRNSSYHIWWPWDIPKLFDHCLTPADLCMTFDPSNALCSGQGFFLPNLIAIGHYLAIWPLINPGWTLHDLWPQQYTTLRSGVLSTKFGAHKAFLSNLIPGWPLNDLWPEQCITLWSVVLPTKFGGGHRAFLKHFDFWITFDLWWGRFESNYALKPRWPVPYPNAKLQLDTSKHGEMHSRTYILTYPFTYRRGYSSSIEYV